MSRRVFPVATILSILATASPVTAQESFAQMEGFVIAMPSGQHLPGSLVLLASGQRSLTDVNGRFALAGLTPGTHDVAIVAPGCQIAFASVHLEPWQTRRIGFTVQFQEEVHADEVRRHSAEGVLVTSAEIAEMQVTELSEVLRRVAPTMIGGPGGRLTMGRGYVNAQGTNAPVMVVDGVRRGESNKRTLDEINPEDVSFLEIYKGAAGGWSYGSEGSGGVISITTKSGVGSDAPPMDPELCEIPDWP